MQREYNNLQEELQRYTLQINSLISSYNSTREEFDQLNSNISSSRSKKYRLGSQLQNTYTEISTLQCQLQNIIEQIPSSQYSANQEERENSIYQQEVETLLANLNQFQTEHNHQQEVLQQMRNLAELHQDIQTNVVKPSEIFSDIDVNLTEKDAIQEACQKKLPEQFNRIIDQLENIDLQDNNQATILMHALANGFYPAVDKILSRGANVNLVDKDNSNALLYMARLPSNKYLKIIGEQTTNLNYTNDLQSNNSYHGSVLHIILKNINVMSDINLNYLPEEDKGTVYLSGNGSMSITASEGIHTLCIGDGPNGWNAKLSLIHQMMIYLVRDKEYNINIQDQNGITPFFIACATKYHALCKKMLLDFSINFIVKDCYGFDAFLWSLEPRDLNLCKLALEKAGEDYDIDTQDNQGKTALYWSILYKTNDITEFLLLKGANSIKMSSQGYSPWHVAGQLGNLKALELMYENSFVDIKSEDKFAVTSLWLAAKFGQKDAVEFLYSKNADINSTNSAGVSPLHVALAETQEETAQKLILLGADINLMVAPQNWTAFSIACNKKLRSVVDLLIEREDFQHDFVEANGYNCITRCISFEDTKLVKHFINLGYSLDSREGNGRTALCLSLVYKNLDFIRNLLEEGADPNIAEKENATPLYIAMSTKGEIGTQMIQLLIDYNADVNIGMDDGDTPMHMLAYHNTLRSGKLILEHGAQINITNNEGKSPLRTALESQKHTQEEKENLLKFLLINGADVNIEDNEGKTDLEFVDINYPDHAYWLDNIGQISSNDIIYDY